MGGTNDLDENENFDIKPRINMIASTDRNLKITIMEIPYRYDYPEYNNKIRETNTVLKDESSKYKKKISSMSLKDLNKNDYSYDGLHLNKNGKFHLAEIIANHFKTLVIPNKVRTHINQINQSQNGPDAVQNEQYTQPYTRTYYNRYPPLNSFNPTQ